MTSYPNSEITNYKNTTSLAQAQSTTTIQESINSLSIIIAVVASFAVFVSIAGAVFWFRNRRAKQGKRQQSGKKTTIGTRTFENKNEGIAAISECTKQQTKQQQQQNHPNQQQQLQPNYQACAKHANKSKIHIPNSHHYENIANFPEGGRIKDAKIGGYITSKTIPQASTSVNGYEIPLKNADNIHELDGYVVMQSIKTSSVLHDTYITFNYSASDLKTINQPQYENIPGCSH